MTRLYQAPDHLRGGKLNADDQRERDQLIGERYLAGDRQSDIEEAFLISRGTVWAALKRCNAQISMSEVALRRERRKRMEKLS